MIHARDLLDFKPKKGRYTWMNNIVGAANISAHLDRFLVQSSLMEGKILISSKILPKLTFDHHPISLLLEEEEDLGHISLCFSPLWIERDGFWETMTQVWSQFVEESPSCVWEYKLKRTKYALKSWVKKYLTTLMSNSQDKVQVLAEIQLDMEDSEITKSHLDFEQATQLNSFLSFRQEEEYLCLKSRSLWLQAGDKNTIFFHRQCRARLSRNHISEIYSSEGEVIKGHVITASCKNTFTAFVSRRQHL